MYFNEATLATNKSEKTLKRYIKKGDLQWRRMGKQTNSPIQVWITEDFVASVGGDLEHRVEDPDIFDAEPQEVDCSPDAEPTSAAVDAPETSPEKNPYELMIKTMVTEFTVHLDRQREVLFDLRKELQEKDVQLRLLPDLQRQLEEKEKLAHLQTLALEKQVEALKTSMQHQEQVVEELQSDNEKRAKIAEELQHENEKLRTEVERIQTKRTWLSWFLGRPQQ